jgi:hypothetical protein
LCIASTWDGQDAEACEIVILELSAKAGCLSLAVEAPFHGDPPPAPSPGSLDGLWDFEVVELFIAGPGERYLEVELGPYGHYLALRLDGVRRRAGGPLELEYRARVEGGRWRGEALIPQKLIPEGPHRVNAYAMYGGLSRRYLAYAPAPGDKPDFHRLEHFVPVVLPTGC